MTPLAPLQGRPARSLAGVALLGAALVLPLLVALTAPTRPVSAEPDAPREAGGEARSTVLPTWSDDLLDLVRRLPVQEGGRVKPLSTWARFTLLRLNGKASYKPEPGTSAEAEARSALAWALDCLYFPELAKEQRIFLVEEGQVLETLRLEIPDRKKRDRYSYAELAPARETLDRKATEFAKELRDKERRDGKVRHGDFTPAQWELQRLDANVTVYERMLATLDFARTTIDATPLAGHLEGLADPARAAPVEVLRRLPAVWNRLRDTATPGADGAPTFTDEGRALLEAISTVRTRLQGVVTERDALALFPPGPHALASDTWFGPQEAFLRAEDGVPGLVAKGHAHYLGGWPDDGLLSDILRRLATGAGLSLRDLPDGVRLRRHGGHVFAFNYGTIPFDLAELGWTGAPLLGELVLEPSGVAIMPLTKAGY